MSLVNFVTGPGPVGQVVRVSTTSPVITTQAPVTLRNATSEYNMIDKLVDVDTSARVNNSVIIYNESRDIYEVKVLDVLSGTIDGGTY